ncbi:NAD-dependent epimerase/dehydratase family protein [Paenibacillus humicola]|uniref:NAD-dependent epimerase/dehydratase family protein n=1 Tax=Paenibacillus humicola TaxID=3110540 RepID=UPI00237A88CF|nr:NAD(P)-dependent oxidoreductase [Paenibacillus humicola]
MNILVTGVNGFIGEKVARKLAETHEVIGMARSPLKGEAGFRFVKGSFGQTDDLRRLNGFQINAVVHLAAVTGGCSEEDGLAVNVQGTGRLFRYLLDNGCRRFVTASSIAAAGCLDDEFVPLALPIPDDHPCLAKDAYGFSKTMVEELTRYFHRNHPGTEFVNLRLGSVVEDERWTPPRIEAVERLTLPFVLLARVYASDVVEGIARIVEAPVKDRVVTCNFVGPDISSNVPAAQVIKSYLGKKAAAFNLEIYRSREGEFKPLYDIGRLKEEFGFEPAKSTRFPAAAETLDSR